MTLGSTWRHRQSKRLAVIVREPTRRRGLEYRYVEPVRQRVTMFTRPYTSTRQDTPEGFEERFEEVRDADR